VQYEKSEISTSSSLLASFAVGSSSVEFKVSQLGSQISGYKSRVFDALRTMLLSEGSSAAQSQKSPVDFAIKVYSAGFHQCGKVLQDNNASHHDFLIQAMTKQGEHLLLGNSFNTRGLYAAVLRIGEAGFVIGADPKFSYQSWDTWVDTNDVSIQRNLQSYLTQVAARTDRYVLVLTAMDEWTAKLSCEVKNLLSNRFKVDSEYFGRYRSPFYYIGYADIPANLAIQRAENEYYESYLSVTLTANDLAKMLQNRRK